jgi:putative RNA 2'-phosphotransferase
MDVKLVPASKFLGLILRHQPEVIGLSLDALGWADIDGLIELANQHGHRLTRPLIEQVVASNDKQRFAISDDGLRIRANQGHSIPIDLALIAIEPPAVLFHGTASHFITSIREQGLLKRGRQHVHLSSDRGTAIKVGQRHGTPVVLEVRAGEMHRQGLTFYRSENAVWLTDHVAPSFIGWPV